MFDLSGHVALVTGGNSGIGLGMARGLAAAGASVAVWGRNEEKNAAAVAELGDGAVAFRCDVADADQVAAAFAATVERFGRVDSCFANAGVGAGAPFVDQTPELYEWVRRVNLDGVVATLQAATRHMIERGGGGSLVVTSSLSATEGAARMQPYAATKGAVLSIVRGLAVELARHGIRANAVLPGWIDTAMTEAGFATEGFRTKVLPRVPMRRWGTGDDFAGIAVYLASDASRYHTGDTLVIDGGYSIF